tara:strand:- start:855 stop:1133 length:279 start_codon:yes stop_codon:yes gene_type:complete
MISPDNNVTNINQDIEITVKDMTSTIKKYLPKGDSIEMIHDACHQEMLKQLFAALNDKVHSMAPAKLQAIMKHCVGKNLEVSPESLDLPSSK